MRRRSGRGWREALAITVATVAALALGGCSGEGDGDDPSGGSGTGGEHAVETDATLGKVRGGLDEAQAEEVLSAVTEVIDGWIDGGYGGDYPRADFASAFGAFTGDARELALARAAVMSNADLGAGLERAEVTRRSVSVDVLAADGRPAGATAHVVVTVELAGDVERTDQISGRLLLTPGKQGWRVFGFDVSRGEEGA